MAKSVPTVIAPAITCGPPNQSRIKMPIARDIGKERKMIAPGDDYAFALVVPALVLLLEAANSCGSRAKALTTLMPVRLSCMRVESTPIWAWIVRHMGSTTRPKPQRHDDQGNDCGRGQQGQAWIHQEHGEHHADRQEDGGDSWTIPVPAKRSVSEISPVARLMRSPVCALSWKAKGRVCTARKKSLRRS